MLQVIDKGHILREQFLKLKQMVPVLGFSNVLFFCSPCDSLAVFVSYSGQWVSEGQRKPTLLCHADLVSWCFTLLPVNLFISSICSLHVSVSHFGNSCSVSNLFFIVVFVMVTCDQQSLILLQLAKGSDQSVQSLSRVLLFATPWTSLSITNSRSVLKPMTFALVIPSNHLISVILFSSGLQSCPSGSFPVSQVFTSGGQSIGASASTSVLPMMGSDNC